MSAATVRDSLALALESFVTAPIYIEQPDALTPEAVTVEWESTQPADLPGMVSHALQLVCWPYTDLTTRGPNSHYASRDRLLEGCIECVYQWVPPQGAAMTSWDAALDERDLGQQRTRVAVVTTYITDSYLCA